MKFNFRKIASVLASAVMLGSTVGIAAAANYPAPFVSSAGGDVAVVVGSNAATGDFLAAADLGTNLQAELAKLTATSGVAGAVSTSGETASLYTSSSKIYANSTLNAVKSVLTKTELPTVLKEESFSGNVDAKTTQTIVLGSYPQVTFAKQPTSSEDPVFALTTSSSSGLHTYNATVDFNKAVIINHSDSKNQQLTLFGQKFTVGASTGATDLILLKEASKVDLTSDAPSQEVTISGKKYTVELVSASDTAATIKVTDEAGSSDSKEVSEGYSKKIQGLTIAINTADETNFKLSAAVVAGAEKYTLTSGSSVTYGESDTVVDGTIVNFSGGLGALTKIVVSVRAPTSDKDAIKPGESFKDSVFGSFKLELAGLNIADDSTTSRESIKLRSSGDDKMTAELTDNRGNAKTIQWAINNTGLDLRWDSDGHRIHVAEQAVANRSDYIVVGNEDEGRLLKVYQITNQTTGYSNDAVRFQDVFSGDTIDATLTSEGAGTVTVGGKVYSILYEGASTASDDARTVRLNYPDSSGDDLILYPTFQTSKGAKAFFYKPIILNFTLGPSGTGNYINLDGDSIRFPNGADAYQGLALDLTVTDYGAGNFSVACGTTTTVVGNGTTSAACTLTNTGLTYNFTIGSAVNSTTIYLADTTGGGNIVDPAFVILEEKDDANRYEAVIVTLEPGNTGDDGIGVSEIIRTWNNDAVWNEISLYTDSKKTKEADKWGVIGLIDSSDSDQKSATLSYPDEQIYAQLYIGAVASAVTSSAVGTGTVTELGSVTVKDTEVSLVSSKSLIVVGGSCINEAAQKVLDKSAAVCGADFTTATGVGADQALIKVVKNPYLAADTTKIAMLVAGYEAADTTKAVKYLTTSKPSTAVGELKLSTSGTVATIVTSAA